MRHSFRTLALAALSAAVFVPVAEAREQVRVVGSSTVYPFSTAVAEQFGKKNRELRTPVVESTGTGGGFKIFCEGVGERTPDFTNASRRMKKSEFEMCQRNGVTKITEVKIGFDGITIAHSKRAPQVHLMLKEIFLALAKEVPNAEGVLAANPHRKWSEINPQLPHVKIEVLGPPPTSGTRDSFHELAMQVGCAQLTESSTALQALKRADKNRYETVCITMRTDGAFVEAGENDNVIVQKLVTNQNAFGIFGYSFLAENEDRLRGVSIENKSPGTDGVGTFVPPTFGNISSGRYPLSRPLFFYVKNQHVEANIAMGMMSYLAEFMSMRAMGTDGYLARLGLVPMPEDMRAQEARDVMSLTPLAGSLLH